MATVRLTLKIFEHLDKMDLQSKKEIEDFCCKYIENEIWWKLSWYDLVLATHIASDYMVERKLFF